MTTYQRIQKMSKDEYQAFVQRLEKRHAPNKNWEELPLSRPNKTSKRAKKTTLKRHTIILPETVWHTITLAAQRHGVKTSSVIAGCILNVTEKKLDQTIDRLKKHGDLILEV